MSLPSLPDDILQLILKFLDQNDLNALIQTCHHLYDNYLAVLYYRDIKYHNRSALLWAAKVGHEGTAIRSLRQGPFTETRDKDGWTPLYLAVHCGHEGIFHQLISLNGLNLETKGLHRRTPLATAAGNGRQAMVERLLEKGADPESKDTDGQTPLTLAAVQGHEKIVQILLERGAALEHKDRLGQTALSWAAEEGHVATVQLLLAKGALPDSSDKHGQTPLLFAAKNGHDLVARILLEAGADPNSATWTGNTPLICAALYARKDVAVFKLLLEAGSNPTHMNSAGATAVLMASMDFGLKEPNTDVVNLLLEETARWMRIRAVYYNCSW